MGWASVITGAGWGTGAVQGRRQMKGKLADATENESGGIVRAVYFVYL